MISEFFYDWGLYGFSIAFFNLRVNLSFALSRFIIGEPIRLVIKPEGFPTEVEGYDFEARD